MMSVGPVATLAGQPVLVVTDIPFGPMAFLEQVGRMLSSAQTQ
jgi:hypothetical protein